MTPWGGSPTIARRAGPVAIARQILYGIETFVNQVVEYAERAQIGPWTAVDRHEGSDGRDPELGRPARGLEGPGYASTGNGLRVKRASDLRLQELRQKLAAGPYVWKKDPLETFPCVCGYYYY